jgi:hypothetical protein
MFRFFARKKKEEHMHRPEQNQEQAKARAIAIAMEATDRLVEDRKKEAEREKIVCPIDAEAMNKCIGLAIKEADHYGKQMYIHNFYLLVRARESRSRSRSNLSSRRNHSQSVLFGLICDSLPKGEDNEFVRVFSRLTSNGSDYNFLESLHLHSIFDVDSELIIGRLYDFCKSVNDGSLQ